VFLNESIVISSDSSSNDDDDDDGGDSDSSDVQEIVPQGNARRGKGNK
jgi:hypothetical protein